MLRKFLFLYLALFTSVILIACGNSSKSTDTNKIAIPVSSSPEEANYQSIQKQLEDAGFENVTTHGIEDLVIGIFTKDGEVEKITVKGIDSFSKGDLFEKDVPITIHYHTFKNRDNSEDPKENSNESSSSVPSEQEVSTETSSSQSLPQTEIITPDNPDFAYILSKPDESKAKEFFEKYKGAIIEFDGHVAHVMSRGNYKTRFDYLIEGGDWVDENTSNYTGVPMKFENVNFYDLKIADNTDSVPLGLNLHIKARIIGVAKQGQLIFLEPVELRSR